MSEIEEVQEILNSAKGAEDGRQTIKLYGTKGEVILQATKIDDVLVGKFEAPTLITGYKVEQLNTKVDKESD